MLTFRRAGRTAKDSDYKQLQPLEVAIEPLHTAAGNRKHVERLKRKLRSKQRKIEHRIEARRQLIAEQRRLFDALTKQT